MNSIKSYMGLLAMSGLLSSVMQQQFDLGERNNLKPEDIDVKPKKKLIPKGCKVYDIEGVEIVALNEKSAIKKYNKLTIKN